jgi:hypothetical protein
MYRKGKMMCRKEKVRGCDVLEGEGDV